MCLWGKTCKRCFAFWLEVLIVSSVPLCVGLVLVIWNVFGCAVLCVNGPKACSLVMLLLVM